MKIFISTFLIITLLTGSIAWGDSTRKKREKLLTQHIYNRVMFYRSIDDFGLRTYILWKLYLEVFNNKLHNKEKVKFNK